MKRIEVEFVNNSLALARGHGSREMLIELRRRSPVWATLSRGWVCQPHTANDLISLAESRGYEVIVSEPGERKDPGAGRW